MSTPAEPAPATEPDVSPGDVVESPSEPEEDGSNPHDKDPDKNAPPDPAGIPDAHPSNSPEES